MESYNKKIAGNDKFELIHVSYDEDAASALKWAKKEKFPWPTVLNDKLEAVDLERFSGEFVPEYKLISKEGEVLAEGKDECFAKIAAL